jgi:hypothetical protein
MGLATVYQAGFLSGEGRVERDAGIEHAQGTLRRRSAIDRSALPWL